MQVHSPTIELPVKIKEIIQEFARNDRRLESFQSIHQETCDELFEGLSLAISSQEDISKEAVAQIASHLYWFNQGLKTADIAFSLSMTLQEFRRCVKPLYLNCKVCRKKKTPVSSRDHMRRITAKKNPGRLICPDCVKSQKTEKESKLKNRAESNFHEIVPGGPIVKEVVRKIDPDLASMPYQDYLKTDHWKQVRAAAIRRAGFACQLCNHKGEIHVHHRTYERRGAERNNDVIAICGDCHRHFHHIIKTP